MSDARITILVKMPKWDAMGVTVDIPNFAWREEREVYEQFLMPAIAQLQAWAQHHDGTTPNSPDTPGGIGG